MGIAAVEDFSVRDIAVARCGLLPKVRQMHARKHKNPPFGHISLTNLLTPLAIIIDHNPNPIIPPKLETPNKINLTPILPPLPSYPPPDRLPDHHLNQAFILVKVTVGVDLLTVLLDNEVGSAQSSVHDVS
jgi:hypothetical protein